MRAQRWFLFGFYVVSHGAMRRCLGGGGGGLHTIGFPPVPDRHLSRGTTRQQCLCLSLRGLLTCGWCAVQGPVFDMSWLGSFRRLLSLSGPHPSQLHALGNISPVWSDAILCLLYGNVY